MMLPSSIGSTGQIGLVDIRKHSCRGYKIYFGRCKICSTLFQKFFILRRSAFLSWILSYVGCGLLQQRVGL
jgi:hypothetical protein